VLATNFSSIPHGQERHAKPSGCVSMPDCAEKQYGGLTAWASAVKNALQTHVMQQLLCAGLSVWF